MKNLRDGFDQERLGEAGRASDEAMSAGEQRDEELFDDLLLADNDFGQFRFDLGAARNNLFNGLFFSSGWVCGYFHAVGLSNIVPRILEPRASRPINRLHSRASFV